MNYYFDNAATSFPKPSQVSYGIKKYLDTDGAPYGRSFYNRAFKVSSTVEDCRDLLSNILNISTPERLTFTPNATFALNTLIQKFKYKHKKVLVSSMEHNGVMRPLQFLKNMYGIEYSILPSLPDGLIDLDKLRLNSPSILNNSDLIIINHMSNVNGIIQPIKELKQIVGDIPVLLDCAQSAGHIPININDWNIEFAAFTGHKSLLGPTGTGALYTSKKFEIEPLLYGGTGSNSEFLSMPNEYPDLFEAGTQNIAGIYGLYEALKNKPEPLHTKENFTSLLNNLENTDSITVHKAKKNEYQGELFSLNHKKTTPSNFAMKLFSEFNIETRVGLHCAPMAHRHLGTSTEGTVRFALSPYHSEEDLEYLLNAIKSCI
ncbi:MAG: aminotransferase class V-fold PLP-dependent enzyme [Spirochaetales bacterium]|nr:aminotransferase class V-fold PLP-dependent enzyme [Spirochaetales bacterium]